MSTASRAERPPLDSLTKFFYGMGTMAGSVKGRLGGLMLFFYNQLVGLPAPWVSAAIGIALFIDAFWDPIVGQISDRTHTRWGRRHPYIYGATIPAAICFALLFMPPHGAPQRTIFLWLLVTVLGTRLFDSLNEIPGSALLPELTQNYDERTNVSPSPRIDPIGANARFSNCVAKLKSSCAVACTACCHSSGV